jgi:hypothetical protein
VALADAAFRPLIALCRYRYQYQLAEKAVPGYCPLCPGEWAVDLRGKMAPEAAAQSKVRPGYPAVFGTVLVFGSGRIAAGQIAHAQSKSSE